MNCSPRRVGPQDQGKILLGTIVHTSPAGRLRIVVRRTRWCHHAAHSHHTSRPGARCPILRARVHLVGVVKVDCAARFMSNGSRLRWLLARGRGNRIGHRRLARREGWNGRSRANRGIICRIILRSRGRVEGRTGAIGRGIKALLVSVGLERLSMDRAFGNLRQWGHGNLTRWTTRDIRAWTTGWNRSLMVEWLLQLRTWWVKPKARGGLDVCHRNSLLWTRLMHRDWSRSAFTVGGVRELHRRHHRRRTRWSRRHSKWWPWRRWQADHRLSSVGRDHGWSGVG
jgi:hypothetical protein